MGSWITVCNESDLIAGTGVCALVDDQQVAIFKTRLGGNVYAISNYDPIGKANVLSRGLIGSIGDEMVVASPLYKQHFSLSSGHCLEDSGYAVKTYSVRLSEGTIQLQAA